MPQPRDYCKIELSGLYDFNWAEYLRDIQVSQQVKQGTIPSTTLVGCPRDLEACLGLLHMLVDRGFPVQAFEYHHATPGEAVFRASCQDDSAA